MIEYNDDGSYQKKDDWFGYRVIYPVKNRDGTTNWFNLLTGGSWGKLIVTCIIVLLIMFSVYAYKTDVATCYEVIKNPCDYCELNPVVNYGRGIELPENWDYSLIEEG